MECLPEDNTWDDEHFLRALEKAASDQAPVLWKACQHPDVRLLARQNEKLTWAHTLLAEFLRAKALAGLWTRAAREAKRRLSRIPRRSILVASLLASEQAADFWSWVLGQVATNPRQWAEVAALCLGERDDAPISLAQQVMQGWISSYRLGKGEAQQRHRPAVL